MKEPLAPQAKEETTSFEQLLTHPHVVNGLSQKMGYKSATPIQVASIPIILQGKDLYAGAKTGSGKTIAFLAPIAERLLRNEAHSALVLAPTRELVLQIDEECMNFLDGQTEVVSIPLYGGVPVDPQVLALRRHKPRIFIATPGRTIDLVQEGSLDLSKTEIAVLDEADRMCDMGFAPQVSQILDLLTNRKQTLLFSATLPKELNDIMGRYCPNPERIQVDASDQASETIRHQVIFCLRREKITKLIQFIQDHPNLVAAVFVKTRNRADEIYERLKNVLKEVAILHAGFPMPERERTLRQFRDGRIRVLVTTDVFARGIDVDTITHVFQYDLPHSLDDYIHRSGRSGRAGRQGTTVAFVESDNRDQIQFYRQLEKKVIFTPIGGELREGDSPRGPSRYADRGGRQDRGRHSRGRSHGERNSHPQRDRSSARNHSRGERQAQRQDRPPQKSNSTQSKPKKSTGLISKTKSILKKVFGRKSKD